MRCYYYLSIVTTKLLNFDDRYPFFFYNSGALQIINWLHKPVSFKMLYRYLVIKKNFKGFFNNVSYK